MERTALKKATRDLTDFEDRVALSLAESQDITVTMAETGIKETEFYEMAALPSFRDKISRLVIAKEIIPNLPKLMQATIKKALEKPTPVWTKIVLELVGMIAKGQKEGDKHLTLINMSDDALNKQLKDLATLGVQDGRLDLGEIEELLARG